VSIGRIDVTATLARVEQLLAGDPSISPAVRAMMELLVTIITLMMEKLGLNSSNSGIAPSKDPGRPRGAKPKTKTTTRKPGGQKGHPGNTLLWTDKPDRIEPIAIDRRTLPPGHYVHAGHDARQVIDIVITKCVVEYRAEILKNATGQLFVAQFPEAVTQRVQYGSSVKSQSVYMSQQQLIPTIRILIDEDFTDPFAEKILGPKTSISRMARF
jgi:transposase